MFEKAKKAILKKANRKLRFGNYVLESNLPSEAKSAIMLLLTKLSEEQLTEIIIGFHDMLERKDEIQTKIKEAFPELFA